MLSHFSHVQLFATLWTAGCRTPRSLGFSRKGHWSGLLLPPPGGLPNSWGKPTAPVAPVAPALQADSLSLGHLGSN